MLETELSDEKPVRVLRRQSSSPTYRLAASLAQHIVSQNLIAGELLASENALAESYQLSRPNVRQALQRLAAAGLVDIRHGIGTTINPEGRWNLFDPLVLRAYIDSNNLAAIAAQLVELRTMVEVECAGLAAEHIVASELTQLSVHLQGLTDAIDNVNEAAHADLAFHEVIIQASHNRFLQGIIRYLEYPLTEARKLTMQHGGATGRRRALQSHKAIYQALTAHDSERARAEMLLHMQQLKTDMRDALLKVTSG